MASWEFQMTGLEITGQDGYGWPTTQLRDLSMQVEESNTMRLYKSAWRLAKEKFPTCCAFNISSVERTDRPTNKDYGFRDEPAMLAYTLTHSQQAELRQMKSNILDKGIGDSEPTTALNFLFANLGTVERLADDVAVLMFHSSVLNHEEADEIIAAIQKFYSRVTPIEISILNFDERRLSHEDLEILRLYRDTQGSLDQIH